MGQSGTARGMSLNGYHCKARSELYATSTIPRMRGPCRGMPPCRGQPHAKSMRVHPCFFGLQKYTSQCHSRADHQIRWRRSSTANHFVRTRYNTVLKWCSASHEIKDFMVTWHASRTVYSWYLQCTRFVHFVLPS